MVVVGSILHTDKQFPQVSLLKTLVFSSACVCGGFVEDQVLWLGSRSCSIYVGVFLCQEYAGVDTLTLRQREIR